MRILAIADIHGATDVYAWVHQAGEQHGVDLIVLAGDLLVGGWEEEQIEQANTVIIPILQAMPVPVFYIMGNDDHVDLGYEDDKVRPIHFRRTNFGEFSFVGYQYSPPFVGSCYEKPEHRIAEDLGLLEDKIDETTILVTHSPAYGHAERIYSGSNVGSHAIAELLLRRNVLCHVHGHIHFSFGRAENHFNVASGGLPRAMVIDLPSLANYVIDGP